MTQQNTILLKRCNTRQEAAFYSSLLKSFGIDSQISADDCSGAHPGLVEVGGVKLCVASTHAKIANDIITKASKNKLKQEPVSIKQKLFIFIIIATFLGTFLIILKHVLI